MIQTLPLSKRLSPFCYESLLRLLVTLKPPEVYPKFGQTSSL